MDAGEQFSEYPLRQRVMTADGCFGDVGLMPSLCKRDRYLLKSNGLSARLFAASECAMDEAQAAIRETYGPLVLFGAPEIHSFLNAEMGMTMRPVMFLRLRARRAFAEAIIGELERRQATVVETYVDRDFAVVRAEAALSKLLGCMHAFSDLTSGSAMIWMWLLRYEAEVV